MATLSWSTRLPPHALVSMPLGNSPHCSLAQICGQSLLKDSRATNWGYSPHPHVRAPVPNQPSAVKLDPTGNSLPHASSATLSSSDPKPSRQSVPNVSMLLGKLHEPLCLFSLTNSACTDLSTLLILKQKFKLSELGQFRQWPISGFDIDDLPIFRQICTGIKKSANKIICQ